MLLPKRNPYVSSEISIFDTLVLIGEEQSLTTLPSQLHAFLVGCMVEYVRDSEIVHHVLALSFLQAATRTGEQGNELLRRTGDGTLLLAGLFPERASRLRVSSSYFRFIGQAAYASLAVKLQVTGKTERGRLYDRVAEHFSLLERVLKAMRARPETAQFQADLQ